MGFRKPKRSQRQNRRSAALRRGSDSPRHALSLGRLEHLEDRRFLSFNVQPNTWVPVGPAPILNGQTPGNEAVSGRITGIATDPNNANVIYIASAGGGVWKSIDAGVNWIPLTDHLSFPNNSLTGTPNEPLPLFMGSIAVEHQIPNQPSSPLVVYVGTGESNNAPDSYYGRGVLTLIDKNDATNTTSFPWTFSDGPSGVFERQTISKIVIDPTNPNVVYAAVSNNAVVPSPNPDTGVWKSTDGGAHWTNTTATTLLAGGQQFDTTDPYSDLVIDPANPNILYTAIGNPNGAINFNNFNLNGIYETKDGGATWNQLSGTPGLALPANTDTTVGRIALAISPSSPTTLYATLVKTESAGGNLYQFLRTVDGGGSWTNLVNTPDFLTPASGQSGTGFRNLAMAVDLNNPNIVYLGGAGQNIIKSSDGGQTWNTIEVDVQGNGPHGNHHAIVMNANDTPLDGNDGGIWRLDNPTVGSLLWTDLNSNPNTKLSSTLQITQFIGVALHPTDPNTIYGGSQDNGTEKSVGTLPWTAVPAEPTTAAVDPLSGGYMRVDQVTPNVVYRTFSGDSTVSVFTSSGSVTTSGFFERSTDGGNPWTVQTNGLNPNGTDSSNLYVPYIMDPSNSSRLLLGTDRVYETVDQGNDWNAISTPGKNGWISSVPTSVNFDPTVDAIAVAAQKPKTIYAASGPDIFVSTDDGASWQVHDLIPSSSITANSSPINFYSRFSALLADPNDPTGNTAYALIAGLNTDASGNSAHVYRTTDGGITWTNITGNLLDQPMNTLAFDASTKVLYLGTDTGVFASDTYANASPIWNSLAPGPTSLPNAQVTDLEINSNLGLLAAATHGRGAWELQVHVLNGQSQTATEGFAFSSNSNGILQFNDPAGSIDPSKFQATIVWGDGATTTDTPGESITYNAGTGLFTLSGSHTYTGENLYLPTVSITNLTTGVTQTTSASIHVTDPLQAGTSSTLSATEGAAFAPTQVATFVDPALVSPQTGESELPADYSATIFWGDNTSSIGSVAATSNGTFAVQGGHLYAEEGSYTISVVASHDKATPVTMTSDATVIDPAVTPTGGYTFSAVEGVLSSFQPVASFKDPAGLEDISHYSADINWGDAIAAPVLNPASLATSGSLTVGTIYYYELTAINVFGETTASNEVSQTPTAGNQTVSLSWAVVNGATGYKLYRGASTGGENALVATLGAVTGYNDAGAPTASAVLPAANTTSAISPGLLSINFSTDVVTVSGRHEYTQVSTGVPITVTIHHDLLRDKAPDATATSTAAVAYPQLVGAGGMTLTATEGALSTSQPIATFTDPNPGGNDPVAGDYSATIFWGDGNSSPADSISLGANGTFTVQGSHLYAEEGTYGNVQVVLNHRNAPPDTVVSSATVADQPVVFGSAQPFTPTEGVAATSVTVATFTDPAGNPGQVETGGPTNTGSFDYTATINWGDTLPAPMLNAASLTAGGSLTSGTTYYYELTAINAFGETTASNEVPTTPTTGNQTVSLSWAAVNGATGYNLYRGTSAGGENVLVAALGGVTSYSDTGAPTTVGSPPNSNTSATTAGTVSLPDANGVFTVTGSHTYAAERATAYPVTVTVHHDASVNPGTSTDSTLVNSANVIDAALSATGGSTFQATEGTPSTNQPVATFQDLGGAEAVGDYTASINWGDGSSATMGTISATGSVFTVYGSHKYLEEPAGTSDTITVTILHDPTSTLPNTVTATAISQALVFDPLLSVTGNFAFAATEGTPQSTLQTVATFTDPGNPLHQEPISDYSATINWGDSQISTGGITLGADGTYTVQASHTYTEEVNTSTNPPETFFPIQVTIHHGTAMDVTANSSALVADAPLAVTGNQTFNAVEAALPAANQVVATFTDPGGSEPLSDSIDGTLEYSATVNWGDGTSSTSTSPTTPVVITGPNAFGVYSVTGDHAYAEEGIYPISVTIHHDSAFDATLPASQPVTAIVSDPAVVPGSGTTFAAVEGIATPVQAVATFTDPAGSEPLSDYSAIVNWNDGTPVQPGQITWNASTGVFTVNAGHTYPEGSSPALNYPYTVTVRHVDPNHPGVASPDVTINGNASVSGQRIVASGGFSFTATEGVTASNLSVATFTDPGTFAALTTTAAGAALNGKQFTINNHGFEFDSDNHVPNAGFTAVVFIAADTAGKLAQDIATAVNGAAIGVNAVASGNALALDGAASVNVLNSGLTVSAAPNPEPTSHYTASIDWGDQSGTSTGTISLNTATGEFSVVGSHLYANEGAYNVTVTIQHDGFAVATTSAGNVIDAALSVTGGATFQAAEGLPSANQVLATFTDPAGAVTEPMADYTATIAWGDGSVTPGVISYDSLTQTFSVSGGHLYVDEQNSAGITVTIHHDSATPDATVAAAVHLTDPQIVATSVAASVAASSTNVVVANFTDPGGPEDPSQYSAGIVWGNGSSSAGTITFNPSLGTFTVSGNPPPSIDDVSNAVVVTIKHLSLPPVVVNSTMVVGEGAVNVLSVPVAGHEFTALSNIAVATFTHGGGKEPGGEFTANIAWGDGSTSIGTISELGQVYAVTGSHTYSDEGNFTVQVRVGEEGASATSSGVATIATEILPIAGPATPNQKYVAEVYTDVLGRVVDAAGLQYWSNLLDQGQSRSVVAANLIHTPEYFGLVIKPVYEKYLGRAADPAGLNYWTNQMLNGLTDQQLEAQFIASPEFFGRAGGTDLSWVDAVYSDLLGRPADPGGEAFWTAQLAAGESRAQVALGFTGSPESEALKIQEDYFKFLGRAASPSEVAGFVNAFENGATNEIVIEGFIASDEYYARVQSFPS